MKIYCSRQPHTLDSFINKPVWVLCYISVSPYNTKYLVKPVGKRNGIYHLHLIHHNFIGENDRRDSFLDDWIPEQAIHILEPLEVYGDSEQSNWISPEQYAAEFRADANPDDDDTYQEEVYRPYLSYLLHNHLGDIV